MAYRVILDPSSYYAAEKTRKGPRWCLARAQGGPPLKAGRKPFPFDRDYSHRPSQTGVALYEGPAKVPTRPANFVNS